MTHHLNTRDDDVVNPERPRSSDRERPISDREVPIEGTRMSDVMQAWLDGDVSEEAVLDAGAASPRQVELWRHVSDDAARLRRTSAPSRLIENVMRAL